MSFSITQLQKKKKVSESMSGKYLHKHFTKNLLYLVTFPQPVMAFCSQDRQEDPPLPAPDTGSFSLTSAFVPFLGGGRQDGLRALILWDCNL